MDWLSAKMPTVLKCLSVNIGEPSVSKAHALSAMATTYVSAVNLCEEAIEWWDGFSEEPLTRGNLRKLLYQTLRQKFGLHAQLAVDAIGDAWAGRKDPCARTRAKGASFNIPRSGGLGSTERGNPIIRLATGSGRMALPIAKDGAYERLRGHLDGGWTTTHFRVCLKDGRWRASFAIRREFGHQPTDGMLGLDIGSRTLAAVSTLNDDRPKQLYFGTDIATTQQHILRRRGRLQTKADLGSSRAKRSLRRLKGYEANYTKTRCYQVAHEVVNLAVAGACSIAIEDLKHLNRSRLNRASNRKVKRMPYHEFRAALESVAAQAGIPVLVVPARNTSRQCSSCGHIAESNRRGPTFRCGDCGHTCNADRNASVNIAHRGVSLERKEAEGILADTEASDQLSSDGGSVNSPVRDHEGLQVLCPRHEPHSLVKASQLVGR